MMNYIRSFNTISMKDISLVGGKNASLGEMLQNVTAQGVKIPDGFAITVQAYFDFLDHNNLRAQIAQLLHNLDINNIDDLSRVGSSIRSLIKAGTMPPLLVQEIEQAYVELEKKYSVSCDVAVRSSATAEDLPNASFAGQQETFLNVRGAAAISALCPQAFASLFTDRAISYRVSNKFDHMLVGISLGVQKMVRSDLACSGVMFTLDTESGHKDMIFISGSYGLGEAIVQGMVNPDEWYVHKPTYKQGFKSLLKKRRGSKEIAYRYAVDNMSRIEQYPVNNDMQQKYCLTDDEVLYLAQQALVIEEYYSSINKSWTPMDIEWAKDGNDNTIYIVQARPETIHAHKNNAELVTYQLQEKAAKIITHGKSVGSKIVSGVARVVHSLEDAVSLQQGEILIAKKTDPDWEPIMKKASGIITDQGGRTCHAAIVSREMGIAAVVGTHNGTTVIQSGDLITLDCSQGENGFVYQGRLAFSTTKTVIDDLTTPVDLLLNVGNPDEAFMLSLLPSQGVGLARLEFIINNAIKIHPQALLYPEKLSSSVQTTIKSIIGSCDNTVDYFINTLAQEIGTIVAAFYPRPVIVRTSDFKSNEYRQLIGGDVFEPIEENPMIGFRGAARYYHASYKEAFLLECKALRKVRDELGLTNMHIMIPFVRTVDEAKKVVDLLHDEGLVRGNNNLQLYMMCEIPANVLLLDKFATYFDGFSIGSNDLTQLTLGIDRDSALVADIFDERNEAVLAMLHLAIAAAKKANKKIGICGQGPSDYPELAEFLIQEGIASLSLNPDSILPMYQLLNK